MALNLSERSVDPVFNERKAGKLESRNPGEIKWVYELKAKFPISNLSVPCAYIYILSLAATMLHGKQDWWIRKKIFG